MPETQSKTPTWWKWLTRIGTVLGILSSMTGIVGFVMAFVFPAKFDDLVDAIRGSSEEVVEAVRDVEEAVSGAKRETSLDPQKELANRGISFTAAAMADVISAQDFTSFAMFQAAGASPYMIADALLFDRDAGSFGSVYPSLRRVFGAYIRTGDQKTLAFIGKLASAVNPDHVFVSQNWKGTFPEVLGRIYIREIKENTENETRSGIKRYCAATELLLDAGAAWSGARFDLIGPFRSKSYETMYKERC